MSQQCPVCDHSLFDLPAPEGLRRCPECGSQVPLGLQFNAGPLLWPGLRTTLFLASGPPAACFLLFLGLTLEAGGPGGRLWFALGAAATFLAPALLLLVPERDVDTGGPGVGESAALGLGLNLLLGVTAIRLADLIM